MKTVFVTQYALSSGIEELQIETPLHGSCGFVRRGRSLVGGYLVVKKHWHETPESALAHARDMQGAKIKSLEKQIAKLKKMQFEDASIKRLAPEQQQAEDAAA